MSLYLILNIASLSVPFLYSFEKRMYFIGYWKEVFLSITLVAVLFIAWDVYFTQLGVWGFNEKYLSGIALLNLPLEEWLFFFCIPYASIFTHYAFKYFLPKAILSWPAARAVSLFLLAITVAVLFAYHDRLYPLYNYLLLGVVLIYGLVTKNKELRVFYLSFLVILIPFFIVNGVLTGSFIDGEVVWYNNNENMGIRIGTIPIEDIGYAFSMLFMAIILIEKFKKKKKIHEAV